MDSDLATTTSPDPGDDLHRRLRYQGAYGVILLLGMIQLVETGACIYFEFHDDLLVRRSDGKFIAVQVKTKDIPTPAKSTDDAIVNAIGRFVALEARFPGEVAQFTIVSSSGFHASQGTSTDLSEVLRTAKTVAPEDLVSTALTKRLCKKFIPPAKPEHVSAVLKRMELVSDPPGLNDAEHRLVSLLKDLRICAEALPYQLSLMVERLIQAAYHASSYRPTGVNYDAIAILQGGESVDRALIEEKRVTPADVEEIISECLIAPPPAKLDLGPLNQRDNRFLRIKMTIAGVPARNIDVVSSAVYHARFQLQVRKKLYSREEARSRELQLRAIVHGEFDETFGDLLGNDDLNGRNLYQMFRKRISLLQAGRTDVPATTTEELLGIAGMMTEECTLWWTEQRSLPEAS